MTFGLEGTIMRNLLAFLLLAASAPALSAEPAPKWPGRTGIVVLQFDDGSVGHYTHGFRILERYGLKGSFGVVTGILDKSGRLSRAQVVEMHQAGHEIHDHTFDHNAAFWGDPANRAAWVADIEKSTGILRGLGIATRGWNHPGGKGSRWTPELRDTLRPYFDYVAGRVNLRPEEQRNIHWNLKDDPFSLGYGGLGSWRSTKETAARVAVDYKTRIADSVAQGLVAIPLWHVLKDEDGTVWGLEEICKFIRQNRLPTMKMADAVRAIQHPRDYFPADVEQIPNPGFRCDYDANGRPDGYQQCAYAPAGIEPPGGGRAAEFTATTNTWIHGPETGPTRFSFAVRSADHRPHKLTPILTLTEIDRSRQYHFCKPQRLAAIDAGPGWTTYQASIDLGPDVDRVKLEFELSPAGKVYVGQMSWRKQPR
jgi:peptidoglycan/xylan/chitin deacetylase (PgdA/CDA1 family)